MSVKKVLLVFPSYHVENVETNVIELLMKCQILPPDLGSYTTDGVQQDVAKLRRIFGQVGVMAEEVTASRLKAVLAELLSADTDVAILVYCGHGVNEGSTSHGTLVLSYGQSITGAEIEAIALETRFRGTFIRVLNMCEASGTPRALNCHFPAVGAAGRAERMISTHPHWAGEDEDGRPKSASPTDPVAYSSIILRASSDFGSTTGDGAGSAFVALLDRVLWDASKGTRIAVRYEQMDAALHSASGKDMELSVSMFPGCLSGDFGEKAVQVRRPSN
jgi:hypothetical protein